MESNKVSSKFNRTEKLNNSQMPSVEPPRSAKSTSMTNINQMHPVDRPSRYTVVPMQIRFQAQSNFGTG
jgi:hypothetical protein